MNPTSASQGHHEVPYPSFRHSSRHAQRDNEMCQHTSNDTLKSLIDASGRGWTAV